jgi:hypothetical protein
VPFWKDAEANAILIFRRLPLAVLRNNFTVKLAESGCYRSFAVAYGCNELGQGGNKLRHAANQQTDIRKRHGVSLQCFVCQHRRHDWQPTGNERRIGVQNQYPDGVFARHLSPTLCGINVGSLGGLCRIRSSSVADQTIGVSLQKAQVRINNFGRTKSRRRAHRDWCKDTFKMSRYSYCAQGHIPCPHPIH